MLDTERGYWAQGRRSHARRPGRSAERRQQARRSVRRGPPQLPARRPRWSLSTQSRWRRFQAALKRAIQAEFQLEDQELAAEPLPTADARNVLLFFEAAEGGAGVLRRLIDDHEAIARVARRRAGALPLRRRRRRISSAPSTPARTARSPATTACSATATSATTASLTALRSATLLLDLAAATTASEDAPGRRRPRGIPQAPLRLDARAPLHRPARRRTPPAAGRIAEADRRRADPARLRLRQRAGRGLRRRARSTTRPTSKPTTRSSTLASTTSAGRSSASTTPTTGPRSSIASRASSARTGADRWPAA